MQFYQIQNQFHLKSEIPTNENYCLVNYTQMHRDAVHERSKEAV